MLKKLLTAVWVAGAALITLNATAANTLYTNQALEYNQRLTSTNGKYTFVQQSDGNLVLYRGATVASNALWSSSKSGMHTYMQQDGNVVQYNAANVAVWSSGTGGRDIGNYNLTLNDDGSLVVAAGVPMAAWSKVIIGPDQAPTTPTTPTGPCGAGKTYQIYPVCIPTGVGRGMNGTIQACSQSEAATQASRNGWSFGACTF